MVSARGPGRDRQGLVPSGRNRLPAAAARVSASPRLPTRVSAIGLRGVRDSQSWVGALREGRPWGWARSVGRRAWGPGPARTPGRTLAPGSHSREGRGRQPSGSGAEARGGSGAWVPSAGLVRPPAERRALPPTTAAGPRPAPCVRGCAGARGPEALTLPCRVGPGEVFSLTEASVF